MVGRKREWSESEVEQIKDLFINQKKSAGTIAILFDYHKTSMERAIKAWGFERPRVYLTDEAKALRARIRSLWDDGSSANQIAITLSQDGRHISKGVVQSHINRMKLPPRPQEKRPKAGKPPTVAKPRPFNMPPQHGLGAPKAPKPGPSSINTVAVIEPLKLNGEFITLETLHPRTMCKYPVGDPAGSDFHFCGLLPVHGSSYCEAHKRRCYQPTTNQSNVNRDFVRNSGIGRALG